MPLLDLKTNLTSIKFGRDRLNSGDSGQPYIKTPIIGDRYATQNPPPDLITYATTNRNSLDYPIRGGNVDFEIGTQTLTISSKIDKARIAAFLRDAPRGTAFIQKQIGLQLTNPKTETGNSIARGLGEVSAIPGILENTRIYNMGKNTLAQIGVSGTGFHLPRHGLFPFDTLSKYYKDIVGAQNRMSSEQVRNENRLLILQQLKLQSTQALTSADSVLGSIDKINQLGISLNRNVIQAYLGGPGSVYGIGNTTIRRFDDTSNAARKTKRGMTYDQIFSQTVNQNKKSFEELQSSGTGSLNFNIQDFKKLDIGTIQDRESRYDMSKRGSRDQIASDVYRITAGDAWKQRKDSVLQASTEQSTELMYARKDMIKFGFECVNNDEQNRNLFLQFRAYLTNGITDGNQATYNSFKYMGRGEDFFVYQGFSRTVSFGFRMAVENNQDLAPLYKKLNALVSQVYPDYSMGGVMRTSLTRVTIGDYLYRVPGFIESVNVTVNQDSSWEIEDGYQLPHYVDVAMTFRPIHEEIPTRVTQKNVGNKNSILYNIETKNPNPKQLNAEFYEKPQTAATDRSTRRGRRNRNNTPIPPPTVPESTFQS